MIPFRIMFAPIRINMIKTALRKSSGETFLRTHCPPTTPIRIITDAAVEPISSSTPRLPLTAKPPKNGMPAIR